MPFETDRALVRSVVQRDPSFAGLDLSGHLATMDQATSRDAFLLAAMRVMACAGNGHSRLIPNAAIQVWSKRIVAHHQGFALVHEGEVHPITDVNGTPVDALLDRFRPWLAGTAARQSVIGAIFMAWPSVIGAHTVSYGVDGGTRRVRVDTLAPALPLYPMSDPGLSLGADDTGATWDDPVWSLRLARFDVPMVSGLAETILTRPSANIVVDLRGNTGGDFRRILPVIDALRAGWSGSRIAVRVDRFTFSAAIVAAVLLQHHLGARLFGEAMGDGLQFWAEGGTEALPDSGAHLRWSSAWHDWETGQPDDTTPPEIAQHMVATGPLQITECADGAVARDWVVQ